MRLCFSLTPHVTNHHVMPIEIHHCPMEALMGLSMKQNWCNDIRLHFNSRWKWNLYIWKMFTIYNETDAVVRMLSFLLVAYWSGSGPSNRILWCYSQVRIKQSLVCVGLSQCRTGLQVWVRFKTGIKIYHCLDREKVWQAFSAPRWSTRKG